MTELKELSSSIPLFHEAAMLLFAKLYPGDEFYALDLLSTVLLNSKFLW